MGRWEPNASGRLREAALELYVERGFDGTTVQEIAQRAGLTARTFFRYFADKREVLFGGGVLLQAHLVEALQSAPPEATPMEAIGSALTAAAEWLGANHVVARRRQQVIEAHAELRERELIKMAGIATALADALHARGASDLDARLAAEAGVTVLRVAFARWIEGPPNGSLADTVGEVLSQFREVTA